MTSTRILSLDEVAKHNTLESLWVVVHGHVFDVTAWRKEHPGGYEILLANSSGKDNAVQFEEIRHTQDARKKAMTLLVGKLAGKESQTFPKEGEATTSGSSSGGASAQRQLSRTELPPSDDGSTMMVGAAVVVLAAAAAWWFFSNRTKNT